MSSDFLDVMTRRQTFSKAGKKQGRKTRVTLSINPVPQGIVNICVKGYNAFINVNKY